jgi:hypothetical protein
VNVPLGSRKVRKIFKLYDDGGIPLDSETFETLPALKWVGDQGVVHTIAWLEFTNPSWAAGQVLNCGGGAYRADLANEMWDLIQSIHVFGDGDNMHIVMPDIDVGYVQSAAVSVSATQRVVLGTTGDTFIVGEQVIQDVSGATANVIAADEGHLVIDDLAGTPDDIHNWQGQTSSGTFTCSGDGTPLLYPDLLETIPAQLIDNTWTNTTSDGLWATAGNWSLGVPAGQTHRAIIDTTGAVTVLPNVAAATTVGSVRWIDGVGDVTPWFKLSCLGDFALSSASLSSSINVGYVGGIITLTGSVSSDVVVHVFDGLITVPLGCDFLVLGGGRGTVIYTGYAPTTDIGVSFAGTLFAYDVAADLDESVLRWDVKLASSAGGSFTNYTIQAVRADDRNQVAIGAAAGAAILKNYPNQLATDVDGNVAGVDASSSGLTTDEHDALVGIKGTTDQIEFSSDGVIADAGGTGGSASVTITPLLAAVTNPRHSTRNLATIAAGTAPTDVITVTDGTGAAVDLSGKSLRLVAYIRSDEADEYDPENDADKWDATLAAVFKYETGSGGGLSVGGADNNQVTIEHDAANTALAGRYRYWLLNVTDNIAISKGRMPIEPAVLDV